MGHKVLSVNGDDMGGSQVIMYMPDSDPLGVSSAGAMSDRVHGTYRGSSDFRKDGQAVGW